MPFSKWGTRCIHLADPRFLLSGQKLDAHPLRMDGALFFGMIPMSLLCLWLCTSFCDESILLQEGLHLFFGSGCATVFHGDAAEGDAYDDD